MSNCTTINSLIPGCASTITLPISQGATGATGATGANGVGLLYNSFTRTGSDDNTNPKTYNSKTLDAGELASTGDAIEIEGMFTVTSGVAGKFYLTLDSTEICVYNFTTPILGDVQFILKALISRTGASAQKIEASYTVCGYPDQKRTIDITTGAEDLSSALTVGLKAQKSTSVSANDIYSEYLRIKKYEI